jgi:hypothetical protein
MSTVTKTVRIDEDMVEVLLLYKKAMKKMFKVDCNMNSMLEGSIINGFEDYLSAFKLMRNGLAKNDDGTAVELPVEAIEALDKYEKLRDEMLSQEFENQEGDKK